MNKKIGVSPKLAWSRVVSGMVDNFHFNLTYYKQALLKFHFCSETSALKKVQNTVL